MKTLHHWIKSHPYKAMCFVFLFTIVPACAAVVADVILPYFVGLFLVILVAWAATFIADTLPVILIAVLLGANSVEAAEPPMQSAGGVAVGVIVICGGGYCVYKLVKFCQKKFPKEVPTTNAPPTSLTSDGTEEAASWNYGAIGSCDPTLTPGTDWSALESSSATLFAIDIQVNPLVMRTSVAGDAHTQSWADFQAEVASHGIQITGNADGSQYFSTNRVPCGPNGISFDALTKTVSVGHDGPVLEIERSRDLRTWVPFLRVRVGTDQQGLRIEDATTATSMFYRVNISNL